MGSSEVQGCPKAQAAPLPRHNSFRSDGNFARSQTGQKRSDDADAAAINIGQEQQPSAAVEIKEMADQETDVANAYTQIKKKQRSVLAVGMASSPPDQRRPSSSSLSIPGAWPQGGTNSGNNSEEFYESPEEYHFVQPPQEDDETTAMESLPAVSIGDAVLVSEAPNEISHIHECLHAVDGGLGWEKCKKQCVDDATFTCQANAVASMKSLKEYTEFTALVAKACPDASWTVHSTNWDRVAHTATVACTYHGTHTHSVPGVGPSEPTMLSAFSDYCYIVKTDPTRENRIVHITKIWNDQWILQEWGWLPSATVLLEETIEKDPKEEKQEDDEGKTKETKLKRKSILYKLRRKVSSVFS